MRILIIDGDQAIHDTLGAGFRLSWDGCECITALTGREGLRRYRAQEPDLVVLDLDLPERDGFATLEGIRAQSTVPILVHTSRLDEISQVRAFELGADDYLIKPTSFMVFLARIKALLRRAGRKQADETTRPDLHVGDLRVSFENHRITIADTPLHLTPVEFRLLAQLADRPGRLVPHQALINQVWGNDLLATTNHLKVVVSRVREKLEQVPDRVRIESERGVGYRLIVIPACPTDLQRVVPIHEPLPDSEVAG